MSRAHNEVRPEVGKSRPWDGDRQAAELALASGCTRCGAPRGMPCVQKTHDEHAAPSPRPFTQRTADVMRTAAAALRETLPELASDLAVRALRIDKFRDEAERDRRRGFILPLGYLNRIDGAPDPVAAEAFLDWQRDR